MEKVFMITKQGCAKCVTAKMILEKMLNNKYQNHIQVVSKEESESAYNKFVEEFGLMSLPAFVFNGNVLKEITPNSMADFFKNSVGF